MTILASASLSLLVKEMERLGMALSMATRDWMVFEYTTGLNKDKNVNSCWFKNTCMLKKSLREMTDKERPLKLVQHFRLQEKFKKIAA
jgi:hypothetical protein